MEENYPEEKNKIKWSDPDAECVEEREEIRVDHLKLGFVIGALYTSIIFLCWHFWNWQIAFGLAMAIPAISALIFASLKKENN